MPAGPENNRPPWTDFRSFRVHVLAECLRLGVPAPNDRQLGDDYVNRQVILARARAVDEVATWQASHQPAEGVVGS